jgi:hypothetical protein
MTIIIKEITFFLLCYVLMSFRFYRVVKTFLHIGIIFVNDVNIVCVCTTAENFLIILYNSTKVTQVVINFITFNFMRQWKRVLLEKLTVTHLVKEFSRLLLNPNVTNVHHILLRIS